MEKLFVDVHTVTDGEQAINFVVRSENDAAAPCPDLLVLDLNLPRRDGFEVLRHVRTSEKFRNIPVLIVTSSDAPTDRVQAQSLGARYFRKPASYEDFLKIGPALRQILTDNGLL